MKSLTIVLSLFLIASCSMTISKSDDDKEKNLKEDSKQVLKQYNRSFIFRCEMISHKTGVSLDTVKLITQEYFSNVQFFVFNENMAIIGRNSARDVVSSDDLLETMLQNSGFTRKDLFLVFYELNLLTKLDDIEDYADDISKRIDD